VRLSIGAVDKVRFYPQSPPPTYSIPKPSLMYKISISGWKYQKPENYL